MRSLKEPSAKQSISRKRSRKRLLKLSKMRKWCTIQRAAVVQAPNLSIHPQSTASAPRIHRLSKKWKLEKWKDLDLQTSKRWSKMKTIKDIRKKWRSKSSPNTETQYLSQSKFNRKQPSLPKGKLHKRDSAYWYKIKTKAWRRKAWRRFGAAEIRQTWAQPKPSITTTRATCHHKKKSTTKKACIASWSSRITTTTL